MIQIILGNIGSGKTATVVREIVKNDTQKFTFSNIITKKIKNNIVIKKDMIIKKEYNDSKKKDELSLNSEFWKNVQKKYGAINVIIDEAHTVLNPRRAMSKTNIIMADFLALLRRVVGSCDSGYGTLTLITQLERRLDPIAREMSTNVRFCVCHYTKHCKKCGYKWKENNEISEPIYRCPKCNNIYINKINHIIETWHFNSFQNYELWKEFGKKTYHKHYYINDIEQYFSYYNTLQWENLISDY